MFVFILKEKLYFCSQYTSYIISELWDKAEGKIQMVFGQLTWSHYLELL